MKKILKFAIIGTACAGKTTLTYKIVAKLKRLGVLVDGVFQQDRRLAFDRQLLETMEEAQYWVICNQILKESEIAMSKAVKIMVSDRSVLDFYAYYETMYGRNNALWALVKDWCKTYTWLYYKSPLKYQDDNNRPPDEFRIRVDATLNRIMKEIPNVRVIDDIEKEILRFVRVLSKKDLKDIENYCKKLDLIAGLRGSYNWGKPDRYSDVDIDVYWTDKFKGSIPRKDLNEDFKRRFQKVFDIKEIAIYP